MVNYYELLEISQNASVEEIGAAIKKCRRIWNNRANNPDSKIRADAEQHVREIADAEKVLLDTAKRQQYDHDLAHAPKEVPTSTSDAEDSLMERAIELADLENYAEAQALFQRVVSRNPQNAQAWHFYGLVSRDLKDYQKARECFTAASKLDPNNDEYFRELGFACIDEDDGQAAYEAFKHALECNPQEKEYKVYCAECLRVLGKYKEAYQTIQEAIDEGQKDEFAQDIYTGICFAYTNSQMSNNKPAGRFLITNERQLSFAKDMLRKMKSVNCSTDDSHQKVSAVEKMINEAEGNHYDSMYGDAKIWIIIAVVAFVVLASANQALLGLMALVVIGLVFYITHFKAGWKWNYTKSDSSVRNSGLQ